MLVGGAGCRQHYTEETAILRNYLQRSHNQDIGKAPTIYFLISETACKGCVISICKNFSWRTDVVLVISPLTRRRYAKTLSLPDQQCEILMDTTGKLERLVLHANDIALLYTRKQMVVDYVKLNPADMDLQLAPFFVEKPGQD